MNIDDREKNGYGRESGRRHRHAHFFCSGQGCLEKVLSKGPVPENAFGDNDGVVHQHSAAQGQTSQGHDIQRDIPEIQKIEGRDDGDRDDDSDNGGRFEILEKDEQRIVCRKTYREDEYFFQGHYPDFPLVPGVILCESTMQAGAILLSQFVQGNNGAPVATRMNDVKFRKMIRPGDTTQMEVTLNEQLGDAVFLTGKVTCEGKVAVRFDFACTIAPTT